MKEDNLTPEQLEHYLSAFTGSESFRLFTYTPDVLTEGAAYLADGAGAYWLMEAIVFNLRALKHHKKDSFVVAELQVKDDKSAELRLEDGNGGIVHSQTFGYTDFPVPSCKLFVCWVGNGWTLMLPSEY